VNASRKSLRGMFLPALLLITGCGRAPSFDIVGSFVPAWLLCLVVAVLLTVVSRALLNRYVEIVWPVLVYPSLTAIFALASWLALFR
jgi:YtcA family